MDFIVLNLGHAKTVHKWSNRDISSPFIRLFYVKEGRAVFHLPERDLMLSPGHIYMIPTYLPHSYDCDPGFEFYYLFVFQTVHNEQDIPEVFNILKKGSEDAREFAAQTMDEVRKAMRIDYFSDAAYIEEQAAKFKI